MSQKQRNSTHVEFNDKIHIPSTHPPRDDSLVNDFRLPRDLVEALFSYKSKLDLDGVSGDQNDRASVKTGSKTPPISQAASGAPSNPPIESKKRGRGRPRKEGPPKDTIKHRR